MTVPVVPVPTSATAADRPAPTRLAAAAGLLAVGALLASFVLLPVDDGGTSASAIVDRYAADGYLTATVVQALGLVAALAFAVGLAGVLRTAVAAGSPAPGLVLVGASLAAALQLTGYAVIATLAAGTAARAGDDLVLGLYDLSSIAFAFGSAGWSVALLGAAIGILRTRVLGRWAGWTALVVAVLALVAAGSLAPEGFFGIHGDLGFLAVMGVHLAILALSVVLLVPRRR